MISYRVTKLEPSLKLEQVALPTGLRHHPLSRLQARLNKDTAAKCGSVYIDRNFKRWLKRLLGDRNYQKLDPTNASQKISGHHTETDKMRTIMKTFDAYKRKFAKHSRDTKMDLPEPLDTLSIIGKVVKGELTITKYAFLICQPFALALICYSKEMRSFIDPCVDPIVELIQGQLIQAERRRRRVKVKSFLLANMGPQH